MGWLLLAAGLLTFVAGVGLRSHVGRRPDERVGRALSRFRESVGRQRPLRARRLRRPRPRGTRPDVPDADDRARLRLPADRDLPARLRIAHLAAGRRGGLRRRLADRSAPHRPVTGQQHLGVQHAQCREAAHAAGLIVVEQTGQQLRPAVRRHRVAGDQRVAADQHAVDEIRAVPAGVAGRRIAIGVPGSAAATSSVRARAVGMPSRVSAPLRAMSSDHFRYRGCQTLAASSIGDTCSRYSRWAWPTSSAWQNTGVPWVFANQMAEPKWSTWAWVSRIAWMSSTPKPSSRTECEHFVALTGEAGVDDHDAAAVGDQGPVHQVGLGEVHGVGDGRQLRVCHAARVPIATGRNIPSARGVEKKRG